MSVGLFKEVISIVLISLGFSAVMSIFVVINSAVFPIKQQEESPTLAQYNALFPFCLSI